MRGREERTALPSSLPRFISIFLRAFCVQFHLASLPRHVLFLFPRLSLCHSRSRRTRSSCFTPLPSLPPSFFSPLSPLNSNHSFSFSLFVSFFALLIHFTTVVPSLSPSFALLFLVSRSFHRFFHDPPLTSFHPSPSLFPLSPRALVPFTHSLFPPRLRRYFLMAPSLPRLYATLRSLSLSLSSFFYPNDRERQPPLFRRSFLYLRPGSIPPAVSFSSPLAFSFPLYIHLSIFPFRSLPNQPSCLFPLLLHLLLLISPRSAGSFSAQCLLRFSNVIDASPPRFFPDFSLSRPPFSRRRPTGSFSEKTQAETTAPLFLLCLPVFPILVLFRVSKPGRRNWNLPRDFPPLSSFAVLPSSFPSSR